MLNEIREYEEYITPHTSALEAQRFLPDVFTPPNPKKSGNWLGLERAMTIIARYHLFHTYDYTSASLEDQAEIRAAVRNTLRAWCGFDNTRSVELSLPFAGWLRNYYLDYIEPANASAPRWDNCAQYKENQLSVPLFSDKGISKNDNTYKIITYDRIIADAIYYGPLQNYYLVCKNSWSEHLEKDGTVISGQKTMACRYRDYILKYIAAYLIKRQYSSQNEFIIVNKTDISHWAQQKVNHGEYFKKFTYKNEPLFTTSIVGGNISKVRVHQNYLAEYDFKIVAEEDFTSLPEGCIYFSDSGSGHALVRNDVLNLLK